MLNALAEIATTDRIAPPLGGPVAIVLTAEEARRVDTLEVEDLQVMALSPAARVALSPAARQRLVPEPFGDYGHARITARAHRAHAAFMDALAEHEGVRASTLQSLDFTFLGLAYLLARVWETLRGEGPWYQPDGLGWKRLDDRTAAYRSLVDHLCPLVRGTAPPLAPLYRTLCHAVLRLLRSRGRWIVTREKRLKFGLETALERQDRRYRRLTLRIEGRGRQDYLRLWRSLRDGVSSEPTVEVTLAPRNDDRFHAAVESAIAAITDPVMVRGLTPRLRSSLFEGAAFSEGLYQEALRALRSVDADCYITRQDSGRFAAIADAAGKLGMPRMVVNYNSFPVSRSAIARRVLHSQFRVRMDEALSDRFLAWSPHMAATGHGILPPSRTDVIQPLRVPPPAAPKGASVGERRRVLYASNYSEYYHFFMPWIMETSNEYLDNIVALAEGLAELETVELTVRSKPKGECPPETIRRFLTESERLRVTGTETPFQHALAQADLLISYASTTTEESLQRRTPVLLWGQIGRYCHLPARTTPPSRDDRAAVYAVTERHKLAPMVTAILDAHAGRPLTDDEVRDHVWPDSTPDIDAVARAWAARQPIAEARC